MSDFLFFENILKFILPNPVHTLFLQACLLQGEQGKDAGLAWLKQVGNPLATIANRSEPYKRHLPLFYEGLTHNDIPIASTLQTVLRTAVLREQLRHKKYQRICAQALIRLRQAHIPIILLKGAAIAETAYPRPDLRHCHDIDLLIKPEELKNAISALEQAQFNPIQAHPPAPDIELKHTSGLPALLHQTLFAAAIYNTVQTEIITKTDSFIFGHETVTILTPTHQLFHLLGHAATSSSRKTLSWVIDAYFLIHKYPDLNWLGFLELARQSNLSLPLCVLLNYLYKNFQAPIPEPILKQLHQQILFLSQETRLFIQNLTDGRPRFKHLLTTTEGPGAKLWLMKTLGFSVAIKKISNGRTKML